MRALLLSGHTVSSLAKSYSAKVKIKSVRANENVILMRISLGLQIEFRISKRKLKLAVRLIKSFIGFSDGPLIIVVFFEH